MKTISRVAAVSLIIGLSLGAHTPAHADTFAYVTNPGSRTVSVIDTNPDSSTFLTTVTSISMGVSSDSFSWAVAITPDGAFAYVVHQTAKIVSVIATPSEFQQGLK